MATRLSDHLPELTAFLHQLAADYQAGTLNNWRDFTSRCENFYTPQQMQKIEQIAPNWIWMAAISNNVTLIHVTSVFVALYTLPIYQQATLPQQAAMEWAVLFHDISKVPVKNGHDFVDGFKSAAVAGKALHHLGFPLKKQSN